MIELTDEFKKESARSPSGKPARRYDGSGFGFAQEIHTASTRECTQRIQKGKRREENQSRQNGWAGRNLGVSLASGNGTWRVPMCSP